MSEYPPAKNILFPAVATAISSRAWLNSAIDQALLTKSYISTLVEILYPDKSPPANKILVPAVALTIDSLAWESVPMGTSLALTIDLFGAQASLVAMTIIRTVSFADKPPLSVTFNSN